MVGAAVEQGHHHTDAPVRGLVEERLDRLDIDLAELGSGDEHPDAVESEVGGEVELTGADLGIERPPGWIARRCTGDVHPGEAHIERQITVSGDDRLGGHRLDLLDAPVAVLEQHDEPALLRGRHDGPPRLLTVDHPNDVGVRNTDRDDRSVVAVEVEAQLLLDHQRRHRGDTLVTLDRALGLDQCRTAEVVGDRRGLVSLPARSIAATARLYASVMSSRVAGSISRPRSHRGATGSPRSPRPAREGSR